MFWYPSLIACSAAALPTLPTPIIVIIVYLFFFLFISLSASIIDFFPAIIDIGDKIGYNPLSS